MSAFQPLSKVFFTCSSHKEETERQLATKLTDAETLLNPLKILAQIPWPRV